ncbi:hypothetical protein KKA14_09880 [bacterium]|nr:hypothetical protein [bacterium]
MLEEIHKMGFSFMIFGEATSRPKNLYLRHDVDICLEAAYNMAVVEHSKSVRSTFFIMLRSEFYNAYSNESISYIRGIRQLGHEIGLHYHPGSIQNKKKYQNDEEIQRDFDRLSGIVNDAIVPYFSIHNPVNLDYDHSSYTFVHDKKFIENMKYISDSRMFFREGNPLDVFTSGSYALVQLLIHPIFWHYGGETLEASLKVYRDSYLKKIEKKLYDDFNGSLKNP